MLRKISTKALGGEEKHRRVEVKTADNEYYLPAPNNQVRTPIKEPQCSTSDRSKNPLKINRKCSHNALRTYSIAFTKPEPSNNGKESESYTKYLLRKVELRKARSSSNCETPKKTVSKSQIKLNLQSLRKQSSKVANLKLQVRKCTKEKLNLNEQNYASYYNNEIIGMESKTIKTAKKTNTQSPSNLTHILNRCKNLIEDYEHQLSKTKRQNEHLLQENRLLKGEVIQLRRER